MDKTLQQKRKEYKDSMQQALNPFDSFDPDNFEPIASEEEAKLAYRKRVSPPEELPTFTLKPKEIMEGQMIGMYESKQDLYLIFAHRCNDMQKQINLLKEEIKNLKDK